MQRLVKSGYGDIGPREFRRDPHGMEHFYERPLAFRGLTRNQHEVTGIDGVVVDPINRGGC